MSSFRIVTVTTAEAFAALAPAWHELRTSSASASFFLTWEWQSAWAGNFVGAGRRLLVLLAFHDDKLLGIAPFYIETRRTVLGSLRRLCFLGSPDAGSDYLDVICRRGKEREVANAIYDYLMTEAKNEWDMLDLQEVPANSLFLLHFDNRITSEGRYSYVHPCSFCPVMDLPDSEGAFYAGLSPWRRKKLKQDFRVIRRDHEVIHNVFQDGDVERELNDFFAFYSLATRRSGDHLKKQLKDVVRKFGNQNPIKIDTLSVDGKTVAGMLHFKDEDRMLMYILAADRDFNPKLSVGNLLVGLCLIQAIENTFTQYDFLKGDEPYKFHWARRGNANLRLLFWRKTPSALMSAWGSMARQAAKILLR